MPVGHVQRILAERYDHFVDRVFVAGMKVQAGTALRFLLGLVDQRRNHHTINFNDMTEIAEDRRHQQKLRTASTTASRWRAVSFSWMGRQSVVFIKASARAQLPRAVGL